MITYTPTLASAYNTHHSVPGDLFRIQLQKICSYLSFFPKKRILDVGCGSGRLLVPLSEYVSIYGVEKSQAMYDAIPTEYKHRITLGSYQQFLGQKLSNRFAGAYFSFSLHQISENKETQLQLLEDTFKYVLYPGESILLITLTQRQIEEVTISKFFPSVKEIDTSRFLTVDDLNKRFNVELVDEQTITYPLLTSEFLTKLSDKYISTLQLVPEDEYVKGIELAKTSIKTETFDYVDCYTYILLHSR